MKKYILTDERRVINARFGGEITLRKIVAIKDFNVNTLQSCKVFVGDTVHTEKKIVSSRIRAGDSGGWIESESNLSQEGDAWIGKGAVVFGEVVVKDNAWVGGEKTAVAGKVLVGGESKIFSDDRDKDETHRTDVYGNIIITGLSKVTSTLMGEGVVKNQLINRPTEVKLKPTSQKTKVKFECSVGDKKIAREYVL
ncbi:hypothetical protein IKD67_04415 [Candidatus Saccharibacteria bacterium]|nr:hypothetical protein [Candidatus Saccharibacteria bacterium]